MSAHDPEREETPPDARLEDAWDEEAGDEADPLLPDGNPDEDPDEGYEDVDPAFAAWLLRLENEVEEQRFAEADQFDEGWRR